MTARVPTPPAWEVSWPFAGTEPQTIHADTAALAAEIYCDEHDASLHENGITLAGEARLSVTRDGETIQIDVFAEARTQYSALEVRK